MWADEGFNGKYTVADGGQQKFGGWNDAGLERFAELRAVNRKARKTPNSAALEAKVLEMVREVKKRKAGTPEEEKGKKKHKNAGTTVEKKVIEAFEGDSDSEQMTSWI